jgi:hypothetical protein
MQADLLDIKDSSRCMETNTSAKIETLRIELIQCLQAQALDQFNSMQSLYQHLDRLRREIINSINLHRSMTILESLHYDYLIERESKIKETHAETFKWIFDKTVTTFPQWLETGQGIFWLRGKAGSGKSTLMKFIGDHERTRDHVKLWAGSDQVVIARYFFWVSGKRLEKSQEGLLRSLLYTVLKQCPHEIPTICARRWNRGELHDNDDWTITELGKALENLSKVSSRIKFFLVIDGLDEYEGEHRDIIRIVHTLASSPHIKICVSSRPWTIFEKAFGSSPNKILLEDLTRDDIRRYVEDELSNNPDIAMLRYTASEHEEIISQITRKANGVFLWVFLVVRSLLRGLEKDDGNPELNRRLAELPEDLDRYFRRMLDNIETIYHEHTSRILLITPLAQALPLPALPFLEKEITDPQYVVHGKLPYIYKSVMNDMVDGWKNKISSRCPDLLEVHVKVAGHYLLNATVEVVHRSVYDFLRQDDITKLLRERVAPEFDPLKSFCRIRLAMLKSLPMEQGYATQAETALKLSGTFMSYVRLAEIRYGTTYMELVDELDRYLSEHTKYLKRHWTSFAKFADANSDSTYPFFSYTLRYGVYLYSGSLLSRKGMIVQSRPLEELLHHILKSPKDRFLSVRKRRVHQSFQVFHVLLKSGLRPNMRSESIQRKTIWVHFVEWCCDRERDGEWDSEIERECAQLIEHFLEAGANPYAKVATAESIQVAVRQILSREHASRIETVMKNMPSHVSFSLQLFFRELISMAPGIPALVMFTFLASILTAWLLSRSTDADAGEY